DLPTNRTLRDLALYPGAVVALAQLADCHHADGACCRRQWGQPDAWHLLLRNLTPLAYPVPARGHLGVWPLTPALEHAITAAAAARPTAAAAPAPADGPTPRSRPPLCPCRCHAAGAGCPGPARGATYTTTTRPATATANPAAA